MAFNADEYIGVIVEQIGGNFSELESAVKHCPNLKKAIKEYRDLQNKEDFLIFKKPSELELREASTKVELYQQSIGDLVCDEYRTVEPLSVGLFGEWGSGKTHLLKLIESRINQLQTNPLKGEEDIFPHTTIPIFFNAWRFEKEEHLIIPLFQTMLAQLEAYEHFTFKDKRKKFTKKTWEIFKILGLSLGQGLQTPEKPMESLAKFSAGEWREVIKLVNVDKAKENLTKNLATRKKEQNHNEKLKELLSSERLESIYYQIPEWIEKITLYENINFVFLIDDLDRCLPENTLKMLESIKLFLDVPSCAFVLAIDDDVVERGVAYHYRDYLKKIVRVAGEDEKQSQELPITGHEYLEKMIQLPFRIPVIDGTDVLDFLQKNYGGKFSELLDSEKQQLVEMKESKGTVTQSDKVLKFFADTIPPKPRKIKRTAMLFQTKVNILKALEQHNFDPILIAKLTLLELFAPKLLRFIQNNNYKEMFDVLHDFSNLVDSKDKDAKNSLANSTRIKSWIKSQKNEEDKRIYAKLLEIVEENYHSRMVFKLDHIFKERLEKNVLIEAMEQKARVLIAEEEKEVINLMSKEFELLLFGKTETQWRKAFDDHELFEEGKALLPMEAIEEISKRAKKKKGFSNNRKWLLIIAEYITQEQFIKFLEDVYPYRMNPYQTTFEEYDMYCDATGVGKPNDEGWGRGKRPVINVSWDDATAYAKWFSQKEGVEYRLPTEDEWYLACNVGAKTKWHFGDDESLLKYYAWYDKNSNNKTHPVGKLKPNALRLYDMHGNVWEWCEEWYDEKEKSKVLRGGSWISDAFSTHSAYHYSGVPFIRSSSWSFRLLRTLP